MQRVASSFQGGWFSISTAHHHHFFPAIFSSVNDVHCGLVSSISEVPESNVVSSFTVESSHRQSCSYVLLPFYDSHCK